MSGQRIGYIRVSTLDQHTERQLDGIDLDERFYYYQLGRFESGIAQFVRDFASFHRAFMRPVSGAQRSS